MKPEIDGPGSLDGMCEGAIASVRPLEDRRPVRAARAMCGSCWTKNACGGGPVQVMELRWTGLARFGRAVVRAAAGALRAGSAGGPSSSGGALCGSVLPLTCRSSRVLRSASPSGPEPALFGPATEGDNVVSAAPESKVPIWRAVKSS